MKLIRYTHGARTSIGVVDDGHAVDLAGLLPDAPRSLKDLLAGGENLYQRIRTALPKSNARVPLAAVRLEAPLPDAQ